MLQAEGDHFQITCHYRGMAWIVQRASAFHEGTELFFEKTWWAKADTKESQHHVALVAWDYEEEREGWDSSRHAWLHAGCSAKNLKGSRDPCLFRHSSSCPLWIGSQAKFRNEAEEKWTFRDLKMVGCKKWCRHRRDLGVVWKRGQKTSIRLHNFGVLSRTAQVTEEPWIRRLPQCDGRRMSRLRKGCIKQILKRLL